MIWNQTKECMSRDEMSNLQSKRLVKLVGKLDTKSARNEGSQPDIMRR